MFVMVVLFLMNTNRERENVTNVWYNINSLFPSKVVFKKAYS